MPFAISLPLWRRSRALPYGVILVVGVLSVGFFHVPILREIASFLIVEDSLRPAAAIIALAGQTPFREMEAAKFYRSGLATRVTVIPGAGLGRNFDSEPCGDYASRTSGREDEYNRPLRERGLWQLKRKHLTSCGTLKSFMRRGTGVT